MAKEVEQAAAQKSKAGSKSKTKPGKETGQMEDLPSNEFAENDKAKF